MRPDALNPEYLNALAHTASHGHLLEAIERHLEQHDGYLAFSGGKDSTVALHLALQVDPNIPIAFFDSGAEFPETLTFIEQLASDWNLNLHIYPARIPLLAYLAVSGAWDYTSPLLSTKYSLRTNLIDEPAQAAHNDHGPGEIWGIRAAESKARTIAYRVARSRGSDPGVIDRVDGTSAYSPVWNFTDNQIWSYLRRHDVPTNPVYDKLRALGAPTHHQRVGPMIDGTHLSTGRVIWLKAGWPDQFEHITRILPRLREFT